MAGSSSLAAEQMSFAKKARYFSELASQSSIANSLGYATGDASACVAGPLLGKGAARCDTFTEPGKRVQAAGCIYLSKLCSAAQALSTMASAPKINRRCPSQQPVRTR